MTNSTKKPDNATLALLDGLVPAKSSGALDLLSGLVPETPTQTRKKAKTAWKAIALVTLYRETLCKHCGDSHLEANPLLLLKEQNPLGEIRESARPASLSPSLDIRSLPIETQTIPAGTVPFCSECIEEDSLDLYHLFLSQQASHSAAKSTKDGILNELTQIKKELDIEEEKRKPKPQAESIDDNPAFDLAPLDEGDFTAEDYDILNDL